MSTKNKKKQKAAMGFYLIKKGHLVPLKMCKKFLKSTKNYTGGYASGMTFSAVQENSKT